MKTTRQRMKERRDHRFRVQFHSAARVRFFQNLPCEVSGRYGECSVENAHTRGGGMSLRGAYTSIVPLWWTVHNDFDTMPEVKFRAKYDRTKQSVRDRAPHYAALWDARKREVA